jgi:N-acetylglutamate synthase-like GNAT family acetyltransferase
MERQRFCDMEEFDLKLCLTEEDLLPVHEIREAILFKGLPYDRAHKGDRNPHHFNFVYLKDGKTVGVVRLDLLQENEAAVRLVTILPAYQNKGIGSKMLAAVEVFARDKNIKRLLTNAGAEAQGFYQKLGYLLGSWTDPGQGLGRPIVQMIKEIR